jgi:hypothetical protein
MVRSWLQSHGNMHCRGPRYDTSELQKMVDEKKRTEADSQASMLWVDGIERFISMRKQAERKVRAGVLGTARHRLEHHYVPCMCMAVWGLMK